MKRSSLIISSALLLLSCQWKNETKSPKPQVETRIEISTEKVQEPKKFICTNYNFQSPQKQADSLVYFYTKAVKSDSLTRQLWEKKIFCAFPNSFREMENIFGYDDELGEAPLYSDKGLVDKYEYGHNGIEVYIYNNLIAFFSRLESIPSEPYYEKYININIDGNWQADNIQEVFGFNYKLYTDTENACRTLSKYTNAEIRSVFRFIFDGPHISENLNREEHYKILWRLIDGQNERLGKLLKSSVDRLISEVDGDIH